MGCQHAFTCFENIAASANSSFWAGHDIVSLPFDHPFQNKGRFRPKRRVRGKDGHGVAMGDYQV